MVSSVLERAPETVAIPATEAPSLSFHDLRIRPDTLAALTAMGIVTPTPIQAAALPALLDGRDLIGQARTGSGKTLAFAIPLIEGIDPSRRHVQALVLTPTRELAVQVGGVIEQVAAGRRIKTSLIFGGRALGPQRDELRRGAHVVVGTPGRVLDLLNQGAMWLDQVRFLVLDEADEMLDRGFAPDVERIIGRTANSRQTALFSATVPDWVRQTAAKHQNDPVMVAIDTKPEDVPAIEHVAYDVPDGDKLGALRDLLDHRGEGAIIVFGRTKHGVKKLARQLEAASYPVLALQGNLSQNARDRVMADFRSGAVRVLVATNVAARGLDVSDVEQVINFELPESPELLTHRVGRTGRMGRAGQAITLLGPEDGAKWRQLERGLGRRIPRARWAGAAAAVAGLPEGAADLAPLDSARAPSMPTRRRATTGRPDYEATISTPGRGRRQPDDRPRSAERTPASRPQGDRPRTGSPAARGPVAPVRGDRTERRGAAPVSWAEGAFATPRAPAAPQPIPVRELHQGWDEGLPPVVDVPLRPDDGAVPAATARTYGRDPQRPSWAVNDGAPSTNGGNEPARARAGRGRARDGVDEPRQLHQAVCASCGQPATVPFAPDPSRPVYCADCYGDRRQRR